METALHALYKAIRKQLTSTPQIWGDKVYPSQAPANVAMPYLVYFWAGGGESNSLRHQDAKIVVTVKAVTSTMRQAFECAAAISALLNDQDRTIETNDWHILSVTEQEAIYLIENFADASSIYHCGAQYLIVMEVK